MTKRHTMIKTLIVLFIYAIAMALVEASVVVYLRALYYPHGFFIRTVADLASLPAPIFSVELWREAATIVMLVAVSYLAFTKIKERFFAFIFAFSIWDLGYYLFLFLFLHWPVSLTTIDVYFLIPRAWIGPVWFPLGLFFILSIYSTVTLLHTHHNIRHKKTSL